ncbi:MAG: flagellar motor stator protein MotA [Alphaproteobacteria bacterium]|nr:flagellar motor stator protein MotA [Alphaproteobacteria bacterium]
MKLLGLLLVLVSTFGGLVMTAGFEKAMHLLTGAILPAAPGEIVIIMGCAISAFLVANSMDVIKGSAKYMSALAKPSAYSKDDYVELLCMMFAVFKLARSKGWLAIEQHIEKPEESELFKNFPTFQHNHHAIVFFCDYLRIISLGNENPFQLEALMDSEIEVIAHHEAHPGHAVQAMADGIPALGIVAAVLGVIKTMASISEPPEVLGKLIGGALVGTFLGVWLSYAFVAPIASAMTAKAETEITYYKCIKTGIIAFLNGAAPQVAVEFPRKLLPHDVQPTFQELEAKLNEMPAF